MEESIISPKLIKELKIGEHLFDLYREPSFDFDKTVLEFFAQGQVLDGCFIAGDSEESILKQAPAAIEEYLSAQEDLFGRPPN